MREAQRDSHLASNAGPIVIVGNGLIGAPLRDALIKTGHKVFSIGQRRASESDYCSVDLTAAKGQSQLRELLLRLQPRRIVLTHGPSDVTWIEEHEEEAALAHIGVTKMTAELGMPTILVSTDNVFDGSRGSLTPADPVQPSNAYGRLKSRAESLLLKERGSLVLRVSLVYGWAGQNRRKTFAERCQLAALAKEPFRAPTDQYFTPIYSEDVVFLLKAMCCFDGEISGLRHLAGPDELSRFDFAKLTFDLLAAESKLVEPCLRKDSTWACRPKFSSLKLSDFSEFPGLQGWIPRSPKQGLQAMFHERETVEARP